MINFSHCKIAEDKENGMLVKEKNTDLLLPTHSEQYTIILTS